MEELNEAFVVKVELGLVVAVEGLDEAFVVTVELCLVVAVELGLVVATEVCLVETLLVLLLVGVALVVTTKARHAVRTIDWKCIIEGAVVVMSVIETI